VNCVLRSCSAREISDHGTNAALNFGLGTKLTRNATTIMTSHYGRVHTDMLINSKTKSGDSEKRAAVPAFVGCRARLRLAGTMSHIMHTFHRLHISAKHVLSGIMQFFHWVHPLRIYKLGVHHVHHRRMQQPLFSAPATEIASSPQPVLTSPDTDQGQVRHSRRKVIRKFNLFNMFIRWWCQIQVLSPCPPQMQA
jgi:hypothetical protein